MYVFRLEEPYWCIQSEMCTPQAQMEDFTQIFQELGYIFQMK